MRLLISVLFLIIFTNIQAQKDVTRMLDFYGDAMLNSFKEENRQFALDQFYPLLKKELSTPGAFEKAMDTITGINIVIPKDKTFKLYSWQLELKNKVQYHAILLKSDGQLFDFVQNNDELGIDFLYYEHGPEDWYGAIYYKVREEQNGKEKQYIIGGFKKIDQYTKGKIVEVLHFNQEGIPVLGKEIFHKKVEGSRDDIYFKLMMTYDSKAFADYTYDDNVDRIIYDHLVSKMSRSTGQGMTKYPDGTYEGYENKSGTYYYVEKMFHEINEKPLMDNKPKVKSGLYLRNKK